jgi:hypothetical protein
LDAPLTGAHTIEIVNNCPSRTAGNKDRVTFWDFEITGYIVNEVAPVISYPESTADFSKFSANTSYSAYTSNGWKTTNAAIFQGGASDSAPTFKCIGSTSATKAVCLNGKTSGKGTLTSPTLTNGLSKLTFNYANVYSENNGVDITITIKDASGNTIATTRLDNNSVTQYKAYEFVWELEAPIEGDYVIVISNNGPSNNSKNKDRVSIWNVTMTGYVVS